MELSIQGLYDYLTGVSVRTESRSRPFLYNFTRQIIGSLCSLPACSMVSYCCGSAPGAVGYSPALLLEKVHASHRGSSDEGGEWCPPSLLLPSTDKSFR